MRPEQELMVPSKGMNLDSNIRAVDSSKGEYLDGSAFHMWPEGVPKYMKGTTEVAVNLPAGTNRCIGTFWHKPSNTQFQWHWNSNGNHTITRYYPTTRTVNIVATSSEFNFKPNKKISGANMLDDEWLKWTDMAENRTRQISVKLADNTGKRNKVAVYFPLEPNEVDQRVFGATIFNNGVPVSSSTGFHVSNASEVFYFADMLKAWADNFNTGFTQFVATAKSDHVELEAVNVGEWSLSATYTDTIGSVVQPTANMVVGYVNRYNGAWDYRQYDAARFQPTQPPLVSLISNPKRKTNELARHVFQFAYYFILIDRHTSPYSPVSPVVAARQVCSGAFDGNEIEVDLSQDFHLSTVQGMWEVDQLMLMVCIDGGQWLLGGQYPKSQWIYTKKIRWANDGIYAAIDTTQATEQFSAHPIKAQAQEQFSNPVEPDNIRIAYGGIWEGHATPQIPIKLKLRVDEGDINGAPTVNIEVWIRACSMYANDAPFWRSQPIWRRTKNGPNQIGLFGLNDTDNDDNDQTTTTGGFPVYIAGLPYLAITEQVVTYINNTSVNFIQDTTVLDGTTAGIPPIGNPTAVTGRAGIRACIVSGDIYHRAIIKSVPTGQTVIIRVADTKCGFLDDGSKLDLNSTDLLYQQSSTNIFGNEIGAGVGYAQNRNSKEIKIDIPSNATGTLFAGTLLYMDCSEPDLLEINTMTYKGYVFDDDGEDYANPGNDIRETGTSMDRTLVVAYPFHPVTGNPVLLPSVAPGADYWDSQGVTAAVSIAKLQGNTTDHNGYYFIPFKKQSILVLGVPVPCNWKMGVVSVTGNPSIPVGTVSPTASGFAPTDLTIINDFNDNKWEGTLVTPNPLGGPASGNLSTTGRFKNYIMANRNADAREKVRTFVEGMVTSNGLPVDGAVVVLENGKWVKTSNGAFSIPAYGSMNVGGVVGANNNDRIEDGLVFNFAGACTQTWVGSNTLPPIQIYQFWEFRTYSDTIHITGNDKSITFSVTNPNAVIGRGTTFPVGCRLYDQNGRQTPVQYIGTVRIPALTEDLHDFDPIQYPVGTYRFGNAHIDYEILGNVPTHPDVAYTHFQFMRGADQRASYRLEWVATYVRYVTRYDDSIGEPVTTSFGSGNESEIYINIGDSFQRYREEDASAVIEDNGTLVAYGQIGYTFQPGDRVQILRDSGGTPLTPLRDYLIKGMIGGDIIIDFDPSLPELEGGEFIKIYRPGASTALDKLPYLELPLDVIEITNPFTNPSWPFNAGELHGGDTFRIPTNMPVRPGFIGTTADPTPNVPWSSRLYTRETVSAIDSITNVVPSLGRVGFIDPQAKYELRGTAIRPSQVWLPGTGTNGSCRFNAGTIGTGNPAHGVVMSMKEVNGVVTCLGSVASFAFYPGQTVSQTGDGTFIAQGDQVLGWIRDYAVESGTLDPASVMVERTSQGSWVKFWDRRRSQVTRLSVNGFDPMTYELSSEFYKVATSYNNNDFDVVAGLNTIHKEYWITFEPKTATVNGIDMDTGTTLIFYEPTNSWISRFPIYPTMYGQVQDQMQYFIDGRMWITDDDANNVGVFSGTKYPFRIKVVMNANPSVQWAWKALWVSPASEWQVASMTNTRGQETIIPLSLFENWEGVSKAAIPFDLNSGVANAAAEGYDMRDSILIIELVNNGTEEATLFYIDCRKAPSRATLR